MRHDQKEAGAMTAPLDLARRRRCAWLRVVNAVAEMREALEYRIWRGDPDDTHLHADCQTWAEWRRFRQRGGRQQMRVHERTGESKMRTPSVCKPTYIASPGRTCPTHGGRGLKP